MSPFFLRIKIRTELCKKTGLTPMVAAHEFECFAMLLPMCRMVAEQPAEKAIKEVVAKIQKQADDEKTEAFSSAKAAALAYHKNISMAHLAYHYKLNNTLVEARPPSRLHGACRTALDRAQQSIGLFSLHLSLISVGPADL